MQDFLEIANKRYSVRKYDSKPVEREKIESVIEAGRIAPSSCNTQPWRYVVVDDPEVVQRILAKGLGTLVPNKWAMSTPAIIVACADLSIMVHGVASFVKGVNYYMLDMGASIENILLQASSVGLGTCWIGWFDEKNIKKILNIPKKLKVVSLITIGYPENDIEQPERQRLEKEKILFYNKYRD